MCAKDKSRVGTFDYMENADDIRSELKADDGIFYKYFIRCEIEYQKAPKAMTPKYLND